LSLPLIVTPAKAGVHNHRRRLWMPAFAGMTGKEAGTAVPGSAPI